MALILKPRRKKDGFSDASDDEQKDPIAPPDVISTPPPPLPESSRAVVTQDKEPGLRPLLSLSNTEPARALSLNTDEPDLSKEPRARPLLQLTSNPVMGSDAPAPINQIIPQEVPAAKDRPLLTLGKNGQQESDAPPKQLTPDEIYAAGAPGGKPLTANNITLERRSNSPDAAAEPAASVEAASSHLDRIDAAQIELDRLEHEKPHDKNGRLKSILLGLLHGLAMSGGHGLAGMIGGAIFGGVAGAVKPSWDEEIKQHRNIDELKGKIKDALELAKDRAYLEHQQAATEAARNKGVQTPRQKMQELMQRLRIMGGTYRPGADERLDELVDELGASPKQGGGGFNPQRVKVLTGADHVDRLVYIDFKDGQIAPRYLDVNGNPGEPLSEADQRRLAIDLERENRLRAEEGLGPVNFAGDLPPAPSSAPAAASPATPGAQPAPPAQSTPQPRSSDLVPTGAPPEHIPNPHGRGHSHRGGYRHGSRGGGAVDEKGNRIMDAQVESGLKQVEELNAEARRLHAAGKTVDAEAAAQQARDAAARIMGNPNFRGRVRRGASSSVGGGPELPHLEVEQNHSEPQPKKGRIKRSDVKKIAAENNITPEQAEQELSADYVIED